MEIPEVQSRRSILLGYFKSYFAVNGNSNSRCIVLSPVMENIEKVTGGDIRERLSRWRDMSRSICEIMILSRIDVKGVLSVFPMIEELALVDLGHPKATEEDDINLKFENIRRNIRKSCRALCEKLSVDSIEIDACGHPKIAAESAIYGIFHRNDILCNIPKDCSFYGERSVTPVSVRQLSIKDISEPTEETMNAFEEGRIIGECQNFARLLHGAGCYITRQEFISKAEEQLSCFDCVKFINRDESWIQNMGMSSILQVANINRRCTDQGRFLSSFYQPPCLLEIHYDPGSQSRSIVLVGRSSFYHAVDSYFITKSRQPVHLIQNTSGGASIIATILALAQLRIPIKVIGIIVICDHSFCWRKASNMKITSDYDIFSEVPDSREERLILKDALVYGCSFQPELIITMATQTNYLTETFDTYTSVIYSSDDLIAESFLKVCFDTGERFIRLPFVDIEDEIFDKCIIKKQFCSDCRDVLNNPLPPETRSKLIEYVRKNWDFCFITSFCLKQLLTDQKWLHVELNKDLLFCKNNENEVFELHEITGSPTRSFIYFLQSLVNTK